MTKVNKLFKQAVSISHDDAVKAIERCRQIGVDCIVAPMESDAQLTFLQKVDLTDYIITEDSDLLAYGDPLFTKIIYKLNFDTMEADLITLHNVFSAPRSKLTGFNQVVTTCAP